MKKPLWPIAFLLLLATSLIPAEYGRHFAGFYKLGEPVDLGENVLVKLTVRIYNCAGFDVTGALVTLEDPIIPGQVYGIFPEPLSVASGEKACIEGEFIVPRPLFEAWQIFQTPRITVTGFDGDGKTIVRQVALFRVWIEEEI